MVICQEQLDTIVPLAPVTMPGLVFFFFQAEDGIRVDLVTGVQTCALPIYDKKSGDGNGGGRLHSFTGAPSCWETTRLITSRRFSPVFSETKVFLASDQPSLKLVERAEIQISRTGVFGETTNLASSGSSKMTSSLPLSPSTSKPCWSPTVRRRRLMSSNAASALRWKSFSSTGSGYQS